MKTSIFDMNFTLPPMLEMTEVVKDMPSNSAVLCTDVDGGGWPFNC